MLVEEPDESIKIETDVKIKEMETVVTKSAYENSSKNEKNLSPALKLLKTSPYLVISLGVDVGERLMNQVFLGDRVVPAQVSLTHCTHESTADAAYVPTGWPRTSAQSWTMKSSNTWRVTGSKLPWST